MVPLELYADARKLQMTFEDVFLNKTLIKKRPDGSNVQI